MTKSEIIAKKINKQIEIWKQNTSKLVIVIDGYSGSGKTTIADCIAKQNQDVQIIHLDDFIVHGKDRKQMIDTAISEEEKSKVFEYKWYRYDYIEKLIKKFRENSEGKINIETYDFDKNDFASEKLFDI